MSDGTLPTRDRPPTETGTIVSASHRSPPRPATSAAVTLSTAGRGQRLHLLHRFSVDPASHPLSSSPPLGRDRSQAQLQPAHRGGARGGDPSEMVERPGSVPIPREAAPIPTRRGRSLSSPRSRLRPTPSAGAPGHHTRRTLGVSRRRASGRGRHPSRPVGVEMHPPRTRGGPGFKSQAGHHSISPAAPPVYGRLLLPPPRGRGLSPSPARALRAEPDDNPSQVEEAMTRVTGGPEVIT